MNALELERQGLELQLEEIQVKRKLNELDKVLLHDSQLNCDEPAPVPMKPVTNDKPLCLNYAKSSKETAMVITDVYTDGSVSIRGKNGSKVCAKKYNIRSLKWIKNCLPNFAKRQRIEMNFFQNVADYYSKKFLKGETISRTTIEKLCYIVDSGCVDPWFEKYEGMKSRQVTLGV